MIPDQESYYEHNFCLALPTRLANNRVLLTPFVPNRHAKPFAERFVRFPQIFHGLPFGPFNGADDFVEDLIEGRIQKDHGMVLFAVYDRTKPTDIDALPSGAGALAGVIGYLNTRPAQLQTEIGFVMILPPFQRTHVTSNAVGLLLHYALDVPTPGSKEVPPCPLGLRRVVWQANYNNKASVRCAERLGFRLEGILRWDRVMPPQKKALCVGNGIDVREGDPCPECVGRDTAMLALCWDDWESGGRDQVDAQMERTK